MHTNENLNFDKLTNINQLPKLKMDVVQCPQCNYRIPVPVEYTDYKETAERYRKCYEAMMAKLGFLLKEAGEQFDVPLVEYFDTERQLMISMLNEIIEGRDKRDE
jgi:DNA-directed RNA polymerase subunit RPC12/RpoP